MIEDKQLAAAVERVIKRTINYPAVTYQLAHGCVEIAQKLHAEREAHAATKQDLTDQSAESDRWEALTDAQDKTIVVLSQEIAATRAKLAELEVEVAGYQRYVGSEMYRSDFQTATDMRRALEHVQRERDRLREEVHSLVCWLERAADEQGDKAAADEYLERSAQAIAALAASELSPPDATTPLPSVD